MLERTRSAMLSRFAALVVALLLAALPALAETKPGKHRKSGEPVAATIVFVPFAGVPGLVGDDILERLAKEAERAGIMVVPRLDLPADYRIEGALTAVATDTRTTVFYDLAIVDAKGERVHRVVGQESGHGARGDPWGGVDSDMIGFLAKRAVAGIRAFLTRA